MPEHTHKWQLATIIEPTEPDPWDDVLIRPFAFCMDDDCEEKLDWTELQRRANAVEKLKNLADGLTTGEGWIVPRDELVPEEMRGDIAKRAWNDSMFSYGMEYGVLAAVGLLEKK